MIVAAFLVGGFALSCWIQRAHRRCIACRRLFPTVAERARHERTAHQLR